jgi:hypothetical protein
MNESISISSEVPFFAHQEASIILGGNNHRATAAIDLRVVWNLILVVDALSKRKFGVAFQEVCQVHPMRPFVKYRQPRRDFDYKI